MNNNNIFVLKETSRGIYNLSLDDLFFCDRTIFFTGDVTPESCLALTKQLLYLDRQSHEDIVLAISSPGGDVTGGLVVYDTMRALGSKLITVATGICASMGSILFLGGEERCILPHSRIMIHDPSYGKLDLSGAKPAQIKTELDSLIECQNTLVDIIAGRTGKPSEEIKELTKEDSYFNAEKSVEFNLAHKIIPSISSIAAITKED